MITNRLVDRALWLVVVLALGHVVPAAASGRIPIEGVVLDTDGSPLAGAEARLQPFPDSYRKGRLRLDGRAWLRPAAEDTTGPDGRFRVPAPSAGPWMLVVRAPGRVTMQRPLWPLLEPIELVPVTLGRAPPSKCGSSIRRASRSRERWSRRADGPGADPGPPNPGFWVPVGLRTATTGTDGSVSVPCAPGERLRVEAVTGSVPASPARTGRPGRAALRSSCRSKTGRSAPSGWSTRRAIRCRGRSSGGRGACRSR